MTPLSIGWMMDRYPNLFVCLRVHGEQSLMHNNVLADGKL